MITDLAKGKTLDEAMGILRKDVSDALGKLPPIKEHCANLATEALHEAIYNYLSKNRLKIPEKLEKEHERIKKDLETIEKRHEH